MKKLFAIVAALLAALSAWAKTESVPRPDGLTALTPGTGTAFSTNKFYGSGNAARAFNSANSPTDANNGRAIYTKDQIGVFAYAFDTPTVVDAYSIKNFDASGDIRAPKVWNVYGSATKIAAQSEIATVEWTLLDSKSEETGWAKQEYRYYEFAEDNETAYSSYLIEFVAPQDNADNYLQICYMELFYNGFAMIESGQLKVSGKGEWTASARLSKGAGSLALVLSAEGEDTVTIPMGTASASDVDATSLTFTVDDYDIDPTVVYAAAIKSSNEAGDRVLPLGGGYFFGKRTEVDVSDFAKHFTITAPNFDGALSTTDVPLLVKLSEAGIEGFKYADFQQADCSDLLFTDDYGNALFYEVDTWDAAGESLVWVLIPNFASGFRIHVYYGGPSAGIAQALVWRNYTGVWHLGAINESTYPNSTIAGATLDGVKEPISTADAAGVFGKSVYINSTGTKTADTPKGGVSVPHSARLGVGKTFTVSGWFKHKVQSAYYDHFFAKQIKGGSGGFRIQDPHGWDTTTKYAITGGGKTSSTTAWSDNMNGHWAWCTFVFDGTSWSVYQNGVLEKTFVGSEVVDNEDAFAIGNASLVDGAGDCAWCGWIDEVRLAGGIALSPNYIAAEYAAMAQADQMAYSPAVDVSSTTVLRIFSNVEGLGTPVPAYGDVDESEAPSVVSSGPEAFRDGICYVADSYQIRFSTDGGMSWSEWETRVGSSFNYAIDDKLTEVTWLWRPIAYALEADSISGRGTVSVTWDKDADYTDDDGVRYYLEGSEIVLFAVDSAGGTSICRRWLDGTDDRSSVGSSVTVLSDRPRRMTAVFASEWTYDADAKTLTDGRWVLKTTYADKKGFTVTGATTVADDGVLDLSTAVNSDLAYSKVYSIGASAFKSNSALTAVYFNEELKLIDASAFEGCAGISGEVDLPRTVQLQSSAFKGCSGITRVVLHEDGAQKLGQSAFQNCTGLKIVEPLLPAGIASGSFTSLFQDCTSLTGDLVMESETTTIFYSRVFQNTKVTSARLPNLASMGSYNFAGCTALTNVEFSSSLKSLSTYEFRECTALRSVKIGEGITSIAAQAFTGCTALETIEPFLPDSLTSIGKSAFENCSVLSGELNLANVAMLSEKSFNGCNGLTVVHASAATNVSKLAIASSKLMSVELGAPTADLNFYEPIAPGNKRGCEVYFPGNAPIPVFNEALFGYTTYMVKVYCDPTMDPDGWAAVQASEFFVPLTDADRARADYPGPKTLGLLRDNKTNLYWLIKYKSPLRKPGLMLLVR